MRGYCEGTGIAWRQNWKMFGNGPGGQARLSLWGSDIFVAVEEDLLATAGMRRQECRALTINNREAQAKRDSISATETTAGKNACATTIKKREGVEPLPYRCEANVKERYRMAAKLEGIRKRAGRAGSAGTSGDKAPQVWLSLRHG